MDRLTTPAYYIVAVDEHGVTAGRATERGEQDLVLHPVDMGTLSFVPCSGDPLEQADAAAEAIGLAMPDLIVSRKTYEFSAFVTVYGASSEQEARAMAEEYESVTVSLDDGSPYVDEED